MKTPGISKPAFEVQRGPAGLRISLPVKTERFRSLLNLVWLLVWAVGEIVILTTLLGGFSMPDGAPYLPVPVAGLFLALLTLAGAVVFWRWLWSVGGREVFLVSGDALVVRRGIWGIGRTRSFPYGKITSLSARRLKFGVFYPSWGRMFIGHEGSEVVVTCAGIDTSYGKGLGDSEAGELAGLLEEEMSFQFRSPRIPGERPVFLI